MKIFIDDLSKVFDSAHALDEFAPIYQEIDLVYVLSGRGSALKQPIDREDVLDPEDDYLRMLKGIEIAKRVNSATGRQGSKRVRIFYNGRSRHNEHLRTAIEMGVFDYPKEQFVIRPIFPENTIGQAVSFRNFLEEEPCLVVAVVSNSYHLPRVARTLGKGSPAIRNVISDSDDEIVGNLEKANLVLFGIDHSLERPGAPEDVRCEIDAMSNYSDSSRPDRPPRILKTQGDNTFLNYPDFMFLRSFEQHREFLKMKLHFSGEMGVKNAIQKVSSTTAVVSNTLPDENGIIKVVSQKKYR